jgi:hypothetical protein
MITIARGTINPDNTATMAWTTHTGTIAGETQQHTNINSVETHLQQLGIKQYSIRIGDPAEDGTSEYEIVDPSESAETRLNLAGQRLERARAELVEAMCIVQQTAVEAVHAGCSEMRAAKLGRIDRQTVRRALGKL